ncbi:MAG: hypothetical protein K9M54_09695 [Kiritimatiellales bacterium]|nr:hypothetical protein [Kiritimatiellales bacterium]
MSRVGHIFSLFVVLAGLSFGAWAAETNVEPRLSMEPVATKADESKVTSVYGISADDYLPTAESARNRLRPQVRGSASHPAFDLPDAFYFIGGPIFLLLFLRVLVIFLNGFEEKRKEEQRAVAKEIVEPE